MSIEIIVTAFAYFANTLLTGFLFALGALPVILLSAYVITKMD